MGITKGLRLWYYRHIKLRQLFKVEERLVRR